MHEHQVCLSIHRLPCEIPHHHSHWLVIVSAHCQLAHAHTVRRHWMCVALVLQPSNHCGFAHCRMPNNRQLAFQDAHRPACRLELRVLDDCSCSIADDLHFHTVPTRCLIEHDACCFPLIHIANRHRYLSQFGIVTKVHCSTRPPVDQWQGCCLLVR